MTNYVDFPKIVFPFTVNSNQAHVTMFDKTYQWGYERDSKQLLDLSLGCGCFPLGLARADFLDSTHSTLGQFSYLSGEHHTSNSAIIKLSEQLYNMSGGYRSIFTVSGSLAIETAVKVTKLSQQNKRSYILGFSNSYHGSTYLSSSISCTEYMHGIQGREPNCKTIPWDLDEAAHIMSLLGEENIACIVVETCSWQAGLHQQTSEWWTKLRELCTNNGIILIVDDVMMGGGKTGKFFGIDLAVKPDIICTGKAASGGYFPLSNCLISQSLYQAISDKWFGHGFTYGFNMGGIDSSLHYLDVIEKEQIYQNFSTVAELAETNFENYLNFNSVKAVRNYGTVWCIDLDISNRTDDDITNLFFEHGIYLGLWNDPAVKKQILIQTPTVVSEEYHSQLNQRLSQVLHKLCK